MGSRQVGSQRLLVGVAISHEGKTAANSDWRLANGNGTAKGSKEVNGDGGNCHACGNRVGA
ncbi:MAG: hypothetical protein ACO2PK_02035 [Armatimonadota bacterium]